MGLKWNYRVWAVLITILARWQFTLLAVPGEADYGKIDAYLAGRFREVGVPGAAFVVITNNQIAHFRGIGVAGPDGRAIQPQTPFGIGSVSKSFGALAVMQLVEAGKIDLDAPVRRYLPGFRTTDPAVSGAITVRHLLHHQSGLPTFVSHASWEDRYDPTAALDRAMAFMPEVRLKETPGQSFLYSDPGYVVLAAVVQAVSGKPFEKYLQEAVLAPLGLRHSFTSEVAARSDGAATGYRYWFGKAVPHGGLSSCYFDPLAGGGIYCSAEDLAAYLIAHMSNGRAGKHRVLSEAGFERLHTPAVATTGMHYAMGWMVFSNAFELPCLVSHGGITPKYSAYATMIPDRGIGFVLLLNANPETGLEFIEFAVARMLLGMSPTTASDPSALVGVMRRAACVGVTLMVAILLVRSITLLRRFPRLAAEPQSSWKWRKLRSALALVFCLAVFVLVLFIPNFFETHIQALLDYSPDIGWLLILCGASALMSTITHLLLQKKPQVERFLPTRPKL